MNCWKNLKKATYIQIIASIAQNIIFPIYTETNLWCFFYNFRCVHMFLSFGNFDSLKVKLSRISLIRLDNLT